MNNWFVRKQKGGQQASLENFQCYRFHGGYSLSSAFQYASLMNLDQLSYRAECCE